MTTAKEIQELNLALEVLETDEKKCLHNHLGVKVCITNVIEWIKKKNQNLPISNELVAELRKRNWAKIFDKTTYSINPDNSVWGYDTCCYEDADTLSKEYANRIIDELEKMEGNRFLSKGDLFIKHIQGHLINSEDKVICKICKKDVDDIEKKEKENME